ncbi:MAG: T9SS type A sorting domain-containing protein [Bacteroidota bacterium]
MKKLLTLFLITPALIAHSQDTLKIMHYNLLNYGNYTSYCTTENNNHEEKDGYIRTIIAHELPDIFTVNEISNYEYYHNRILTNVLNTDGRDYYMKGPVSNTALSDLVNMFYYNSEKIVLMSHVVVQHVLRDIDLYRLYYKTPETARGDTVFLNCIVAHLKAGNSDSDESERAEMTANAMEFLAGHAQPGNYLFMGDLNTYSSYEDCYQNLTGASANDFRFFDPVNLAGHWNNNGNFASVHTQSVTDNSTSCQAGGGCDDRFDHILATRQLMNGTMGLSYITGSYRAVGQDGAHFNASITDAPSNTAVPANVLNALYNNSDHLPVRLDLKLTSGGIGGVAEQAWLSQTGVSLHSPEFALVFVTSPSETKVELSVVSITGQVILKEYCLLHIGRNEINLRITGIPPGVYMIRLRDSQGRMASLKMVK